MADEIIITDDIRPTPPGMVAIPATGIRYLTPTYTSWTVTPIEEYYPGFKYKVFIPVMPKMKKCRVIILFSGGGTLDLDGLTANAIELVQLGYVVIPAQYKDFVGGFGDLKQMKEAVIKAYTLINYLCLQQNADRFWIKKNCFFGVGTSAGAFTWAQAAITANDTNNPYYDGYVVPSIKGKDGKSRLRAVASMSGAVNDEYMNLIRSDSLRTNFFNGEHDEFKTAPVAQKACDKEISFGVPSQIKVYDDDHTLGKFHDDIFYNNIYGIVPTFYNVMNTVTP